MLAGSVTSSGIRADVVGPADGGADLGRHRPAELDPPAGERDLRAVRRQHACEVQAQAAEGAGDQRGPSIECVAVVHVCSAKARRGATIPQFRTLPERPPVAAARRPADEATHFVAPAAAWPREKAPPGR